MCSDWTMTLRPQSPRTLVPITVDVRGAGFESASLIVRPKREGQPFRVDASPVGDSLQGTFWLARPGDYEVAASGMGCAVSATLHVGEQVFLPFSIEFGIFMAALLIAGGGLSLWFRNRKKAGSSLPSSPS